MLITLPPEILGLIFKSVRMLNGNRQMTGAVCKQLLPYTRANLFDNVKISNLDDYMAFAGAVSTTPNESSLGHLVTELTLENISLDDCHVTPEQLATFFRQLPHTQNLVVSRSSSLASLILSLDSTYFPHLLNLEFNSVFGHLDKPFEGHHYAALNRFSSLDSVTVCLGPSLDSHLPCAMSTSDSPPVRHLRSLTLQGDFTRHDPTSLLACHPYLRTLRLFDQSASPTLHTVLESVSLPELIELEVRSDKSELPLPLPLELSIGHFSKLQHLTLGRSTFSTALFDILSSHFPHLSHLTFLLGAEVSSEGLKSFFEEVPTKLKALKKVTFNNVAGNVGPTIVGNTYFSDEEEYYSDSDYPATGQSTCQGWQLPAWTPRFSKEEAKEVIKCAERSDIEVEGTLLNAIVVDDEWTREWEKAQLYDKGAWDDLR